MGSDLKKLRVQWETLTNKQAIIVYSSVVSVVFKHRIPSMADKPVTLHVVLKQHLHWSSESHSVECKYAGVSQMQSYSFLSLPWTREAICDKIMNKALFWPSRDLFSSERNIYIYTYNYQVGKNEVHFNNVQRSLGVRVRRNTQKSRNYIGLCLNILRDWMKH